MWDKKGLLELSKNSCSEQMSHASIPFAVHISKNLFRIFFSSRNMQGKSLPFYVDAIVYNGQIELVDDVSGPLMHLGAMGTFDDSGIMPSSIVKVGGKYFMYYIGWNTQVNVSYRLSIGLAISSDCINFDKYSDGPILDRSIEEPYFNTAPYVIRDNGIWKMWYISCTGWQMVKNHPEPTYHVKYAESVNGIHFKRKGIVCIDYDEKAKAIGRPCVIKRNDTYEMYFSYRDIRDYRTLKGQGYQLGKAISIDGVGWKKDYAKVGIGLSETGWDSKMMEYCHVFSYKGHEYLLYNGNNFGEKGFGYASRSLF